jgi:hypothetical protein
MQHFIFAVTFQSKILYYAQLWLLFRQLTEVWESGKGSIEATAIRLLLTRQRLLPRDSAGDIIFNAGTKEATAQVSGSVGEIGAFRG